MIRFKNLRDDPEEKNKFLLFINEQFDCFLVSCAENSSHCASSSSSSISKIHWWVFHIVWFLESQRTESAKIHTDQVQGFRGRYRGVQSSLTDPNQNRKKKPTERPTEDKIDRFGFNLFFLNKQKLNKTEKNKQNKISVFLKDPL